ncbi:phage integrase SAM-like domain-containing protein [Dyadobacter linearis]|uniref:phage integrase SAM-like domain-containing protein n=1 Tax=Dyadobacter linearis TaxID=2823330 RepID=UPI001BFC0D74|nr:phage integrase SAM-like domain-containing protein [Dyadobacter sp. CECT 9623]
MHTKEISPIVPKATFVGAVFPSVGHKIQPLVILPSGLKVRLNFGESTVTSYITIKGTTASLKLPFQTKKSQWDPKLRRFIGEDAEDQNVKLVNILKQYGDIYRELWNHGTVLPGQLINAYVAKTKMVVEPPKISEKERRLYAELETLRQEKPVNSLRRIALYEERMDSIKEKLEKLKKRDRIQDLQEMSESDMARLNRQVKLDKVLGISFRLRAARVKNSYRHTVQFVVRINGEKSAPQSTGISIKKSQWDVESQTILGNEEETLKLVAIKAGLERVFEEFKKRGKFPTPKTLIEHYFNNDLDFNKRVTLYDLMLLHLGDLKRRGRSIRTLQAYERTFLQFTSQSKIRYVADVNQTDGKAFWDWLRNERSQDYCNKSLERLRGFFDTAIGHGIIENNPLRGLRFDWERKLDLTCLSMDEIGKLQETVWSKPLQETVDAFLFMCYTGLHIGDFNNLTSANITVIQGTKFIEYQREKTGQVAMVPLHSVASKLIDKYGSVEAMTRRTGKTTNLNLKLIAVMIGTKKHLTNKVARKTFTDMSINDRRMSEESVAKMLGHTSTKFVKVYGQVAHRRIFAEWKE